MCVGFIYMIIRCIRNWGGVKLNYLLPLTTNLWWYPTSYAIFLLFYPFYHKLLICLDKSETIRLVKLEILLWCLPSVFPIEWSLGANNTTTFFMIYAIIYYIKTYNPDWINNTKLLGWLVIGGYLTAFASIIIMDYIGTRIPIIAKYSCYFIRGNWRLLPIIISIGIFLWCTKIQVRQSRFINSIGASTFAVYLIHMHPMMEYWLFKKTFRLNDIQHQSLWEVAALTVVVVTTIFIGGIVIDKLKYLMRHIIITKPLIYLKTKGLSTI